MDSNANRLARQQALERQTRRLGQRIHRLQKVSNRVSWVRVGIVVVGLLGAVAIGNWIRPDGGWLVFAATWVVYTVAVMYHRRIERWIQTFAIARDIRTDQIARLALDWDQLPPSALIDRHAVGPLALDLDLTGEHSLHRLLDTTISRQGSQRLAAWITQAVPQPDETQTRQSLVRELKPMARFRDRFRITFRLVQQEQLEGENLSYWLGVDFPSRRLKRAWPVATVLAAANVALFALFLRGGWPPVWLVTLLLYFAFYGLYLESLNTVLKAMVRLDTELDRFSAILCFLENAPCAGHPPLAELCAPFRDAPHAPSAHIRKIKLVTAAIGLRSNPVLGLVINLVLPWDFVFAYLADRLRSQVADTFPVWAEIIYRLDALIALANFAHLNLEYAFPEIRPGASPVFQAQGLGHPLIPPGQKVRNDFAFEGLGELGIITGSNMAGKSTFIKTVGINLCLAYAGAPVDATLFRSLPFRLHTCIRISDSITDGFSYFYAEVKCLRHLLDELKEPGPLPLLYLIDEIFRGTNNRERLLGSRAYIQAVLGEHGVGLLATHDLELAGLAEQSSLVHNYHFRDTVSDSRLVFDYKIRPGPCPTTNALKIMEMEGLPVEIRSEG